jgi:hypothetical protein
LNESVYELLVELFSRNIQKTNLLRLGGDVLEVGPQVGLTLQVTAFHDAVTVELSRL